VMFTDCQHPRKFAPRSDVSGLSQLQRPSATPLHQYAGFRSLPRRRAIHRARSFAPGSPIGSILCRAGFPHSAHQLPVLRIAPSDVPMKKPPRKAAERLDQNRDTMRPEYDFSNATRGITAEWYRDGSNVVQLDPDVNEIFPDSLALNEALRTFARLVKPRRASRARGRSA
jgi:hypothetical protein